MIPQLITFVLYTGRCINNTLTEKDVEMIDINFENN